jgi:hypothetical protein
VKLDLTEDQILNTPLAYGGGLFFCPEPECGWPHLILLDEDGTPMAHYIIGPELYREIKEAMEKRLARKN